MLRAIAAIVLCSAAIWLTPAALAAEAAPPAPPPAGPLAVSTISPGLLDEALTDQAAAALVSIGGDAAAKALRDALPKAKGRCRLAILQGLGVLGDAASVPDFIQAAADPDRDVRLTAIAALGNTGDPAAANTLWLATTAPSAYEQSKAADALFTLAERLAKAGNRAAAERICAMMLCIADMPEMRHIRCAAIRGLARVLGAGATDDLATVMQLDDLQVRAAAVEAAAAVPGDEVTAKWVEQLRAAPPELKVEILGLLARRGGPAALAGVLEAMKDADDAVRLAAMAAAGAICGDKAVTPLVALVVSTKKGEAEAARKALQCIPGDEATAAVAAAMSGAGTAVRRELIGILSARGARSQLGVVMAAAGDPDQEVRAVALESLEALGDEKQAPMLLEALRTAEAPEERAAAEKALAAVCARAADRESCAELVVRAAQGADVPTWCALVRVLAKAPGPRALVAVRASAKDSREEVKDAGVRALAEWPDPAVAPDLLAIANSDAKPAYRVLALRGYIRLADTPPERPAEAKLAMYREAWAAAHRPDERRLVLGVLGDLKSAEALKMAAAAMADEALKDEAAATAAKIARGLGDDVKKNDIRAEVRAAMRKVLEIATNDNVRRDAERVIRKIEKP